VSSLLAVRYIMHAVAHGVRVMIAEIYGKISSTGSNLSDRLEDQLTGDVFGTLRYLDDHLGLLPFLESSYRLTRDGERLPLTFEHGIIKQIHFWPWVVEAEPDLCIEITEAGNHKSVVGIEVKYYSALSRDQLLRQMRGIQTKYRGFRHVQVYLTTDRVYPRELLSDVRGQADTQGLKGTEIYWLSWHDLPAVLEQSRGRQRGGLAAREALIVCDLLRLCARKGFERFSRLEVPQYTPPRSFSLAVQAQLPRTPTPIVDSIPMIPQSVPTPIF
jgi:hypothetical protein